MSRRVRSERNEGVIVEEKEGEEEEEKEEEDEEEERGRPDSAVFVHHPPTLHHQNLNDHYDHPLQHKYRDGSGIGAPIGASTASTTTRTGMAVLAANPPFHCLQTDGARGPDPTRSGAVYRNGGLQKPCHTNPDWAWTPKSWTDPRTRALTMSPRAMSTRYRQQRAQQSQQSQQGPSRPLPAIVSPSIGRIEGVDEETASTSSCGPRKVERSTESRETMVYSLVRSSVCGRVCV